MQDYETRKHFEASLTDLALLFKENPRKMREMIKWTMTRENIIKSSTTELNDDQLELYASRINRYCVRMENTPPDERPHQLNLKYILTQT